MPVYILCWNWRTSPCLATNSSQIFQTMHYHQTHATPNSSRTPPVKIPSPLFNSVNTIKRKQALPTSVASHSIVYTTPPCPKPHVSRYRAKINTSTGFSCGSKVGHFWRSADALICYSKNCIRIFTEILYSFCCHRLVREHSETSVRVTGYAFWVVCDRILVVWVCGGAMCSYRW